MPRAQMFTSCNDAVACSELEQALLMVKVVSLPAQ